MKLRQILSFCLIGVLACGIILITGEKSQAQFSLSGNDSGVTEKIPHEVNRFGNIETIEVESPIDGARLFTIAYPTVYNRNNVEEGKIPVEQRAEQVQGRLQFALFRPMNPETLTVEVSKLNNVTIIYAKDNEYTRPLVLLSVTELDADFNGIPINQLAQKWREIIENDLRRGLEKWHQDPTLLIRIILGLFFLTVVVIVAKYVLLKRQKTLWDRKKELNQSSVSQSSNEALISDFPPSKEEKLSEKRSQFLQVPERITKVERQLKFLDLWQWLLFWLLIISWLLGLFELFSRIPVLAKYRFNLFGVPVELILIWFLSALGIRLSHYFIEKIRNSSDNNNLTKFIDLGDTQRRKLRTATIAGAAKGLTSVVIITTGLLAALKVLGIPTGSVLAIGGLLGLAISFGSQSLVNDIVNGFLILAEDQYAIGDVIDLGIAAGLVENLNLRVTQLRSSGGQLVTIPNSIVRDVKNLTRSWSRVNFTIDVAYETDPEKALSILKQTAQELYDDLEWHDQILDPPDVLGIDSVSHSGLSITTWIKTAPAQQWAVGREFRLRVRKALEEKGIEIGIPRQTHIMETPHSETFPKT